MSITDEEYNILVDRYKAANREDGVLVCEDKQRVYLMKLYDDLKIVLHEHKLMGSALWRDVCDFFSDSTEDDDLLMIAMACSQAQKLAQITMIRDAGTDVVRGKKEPLTISIAKAFAADDAPLFVTGKSYDAKAEQAQQNIINSSSAHISISRQSNLSELNDETEVRKADAGEDDEAYSTKGASEAGNDEKNGDANTAAKFMPLSRVSSPDGGDGDDDDEYDGEDSGTGGRGVFSRRGPPKRKLSDTNGIKVSNANGSGMTSGRTGMYDGASIAHASTAFQRCYQNENQKYSGRAGTSFPKYESQLELEMNGSDLPADATLKVLHVTLLKDSPAHSFYLSRVSKVATSLESALHLMREEFYSEASKTRAHEDYLFLDFVTFRKDKLRKNDTEYDVVTQFESHARSLQEQMPPEYHHDNMLRDRLVMAYSFNKRLKDAFTDKKPKSSHEVTQRVCARASRISSKDQLCTLEEVEVFYTDMRETHGFRQGDPKQHSTRKSTRPWKGGKSRKGPCWVCSGSHFARERHTLEEIKAAEAKASK